MTVKQSTKKPLLIALALLLLAILILSILLSTATAGGKKGSFDVPESVAMEILRYRAGKAGLDLTSAKEHEIRKAANGTIDRLIRLETGRFTESLAYGHTVEQIVKDGEDFYYCRLTDVKTTGKDGRIRRTEEEHYFILDEAGAVQMSQVYPKWAALYEYAASPSRVLGRFAFPKQVICLDEPMGYTGTAIYYDMGKDSMILYYIDQRIYLVPFDVFANACAAHCIEEGEHLPGVSYSQLTPEPALAEYRREDLDLKSEDESEKPEEGESDYKRTVLLESVFGLILLIPVILWKRHEWRTYRARMAGDGDEMPDAAAEDPEENADPEHSEDPEDSEESKDPESPETDCGTEVETPSPDEAPV